MKFSNRQIFPPTTPRRTVNRNHPIIIRFSGPNHPIWGCSATVIRQRESSDNRPIFQPESPDDSRRSALIVRNRQAKRLNRQITTIRGAANSGEFAGIGIRARNASQVFEKGDPSRAERTGWNEIACSRQPEGRTRGRAANRLPGKAARRVNAGAFINNLSRIVDHAA